jgi:hypothetical protein
LEGLQDILKAQATYSQTGEWTGPFKPLTLNQPADFWVAQWQRVGHFQEREAALNMDKKTVMQDLLASIRAA